MIQAPSLGTLRPCPNESVNFDTTENLIMEGDNLEVLNLLQKSYLGKVKMIYIDPPYNTGKDFIYRVKSAQATRFRIWVHNGVYSLADQLFDVCKDSCQSGLPAA